MQKIRCLLGKMMLPHFSHIMLFIGCLFYCFFELLKHPQHFLSVVCTVWVIDLDVTNWVFPIFLCSGSMRAFVLLSHCLFCTPEMSSVFCCLKRQLDLQCWCILSVLCDEEKKCAWGWVPINLRAKWLSSEGSFQLFWG